MFLPQRFALAVLQSRLLFPQLCTRLALPNSFQVSAQMSPLSKGSLWPLSLKWCCSKRGSTLELFFCFVLFTGLLWVKHRSCGGLPPECWHSYNIQDYDQRICFTIQGLEEEFRCGWIQVLSHLRLYQMLVELHDTVWYFKVSLSSVGLPWGSDGKEYTCNEGDLGLISASGRSLGGGNGNPLQYSCLENPVDGGAWWVTQSWIPLSD